VTPPKLSTVVTFLEMKERPSRPPAPPPPRLKLALIRAEKPTLSFSRYLYDAVGKPWWWYERKPWDDARLAALVHHEHYETYVLYVAGVPAGYFELDRRDAPVVELAYFGLVPEFIGLRLGPYLLDQAIDLAWQGPPVPRRFWVNTCDLDHPKALAMYQRAGFVAYDRKVKEFDDPRATGLMPPGKPPNR
jgi:GNAT superfamily N-acetyltransferase